MSNRLTAMDIEKQSFSRRVRGYDREEVEMYLRSVAEEIERLTLENGERREEIGSLRSQLDEHRSRESALQQTLVGAQQMVEETKDRARREADLIVREARARSEELLRDARETLRRLEADISRSLGERETVEQRLRGVVEQHLTLLDMRRDARQTRDHVRVLPTIGTEVG